MKTDQKKAIENEIKEVQAELSEHISERERLLSKKEELKRKINAIEKQRKIGEVKKIKKYNGRFKGKLPCIVRTEASKLLYVSIVTDDYAQVRTIKFYKDWIRSRRLREVRTRYLNRCKIVFKPGVS